MGQYRVWLTRLVEQESYVFVEAPTPESAATAALEHIGAEDLLWLESDCKAQAHAVTDVRLVAAPEPQLGQFEAAAFRRDQRLQRR